MTRTMLITGAASGLGHGLALHFQAAGHAVVATDRVAGGGGPPIRPLDVTSDADVAQVAELPVDVLVSNAGLQHVAPLEEFPQDRWDHLLDVMLGGAVRLTRAFLPGMRRRGFGRIVIIGSIHSLVASPYKSAYVAAKHALLGFAKTIALETADTDITINTICPSYVRTPLVDAQIAAQARTHAISEAEVIQRIMLDPMPKKAFITVEEVAAAIEYLAGPAARNVTGQTITIDGGWTAR